MPPANKPVPDPEIAARVPPLTADRQGERRTMTMRVAILDDYLNVARELADWDRLEGKVEVTALTEAFADEDAAAKELADFDIAVVMQDLKTVVTGKNVSARIKLRGRLLIQPQ